MLRNHERIAKNKTFIMWELGQWVGLTQEEVGTLGVKFW